MADNENFTLCRKFYLTIESAKELPNVHKFLDTKAYAEVLVGSGNNTTKLETKADDRNGLNPMWNHALEFQIPEEGVLYYSLPVVIKLYSKHRLMKDSYIGEVHTTLKDLYDEAYADGESRSGKRSLPIKNGTAETDGMLNFCYSFGVDNFMVEKKESVGKAIKIVADTAAAVVPIVAPVVVAAAIAL